MEIRRMILLSVAFILVFSTFVCAGEIDQRITRAYEHIDRGIQSGSITRAEAQRLKGELRDVQEDEARMLRDGRLDHRERQRLNIELDRLENHIYRAKLNDNKEYDERDHDDRGNDGPSHSGRINVVSGTYGGNCGAPHGNETVHIATQCNGQKQCNYRIDYKAIGDPAPGCGKNYIAQWRCGKGPLQKSLVKPEAGLGSVITLSCQ
jgi:hypothetical protein